MAIQKAKILRLGKRLSQIMLFMMVLLFLIMGIGWHVLRSDHTYVIQKLEATALEKWHAAVKLEGYELEWVKPFPQIRLKIRDLKFGTTGFPQEPVLHINNAVSTFDPWDLLTGDFEAQPLLLDSVWINIFKDSLGNSNLSFAEKSSKKKQVLDWDVQLAKLPSIDINYLDFYNRNDFKNKWQWAKLTGARIHPDFNHEQGEWSVHMESDCYFEGLVFKEKDGGFLENTRGKLDLNISLPNQGRIIKLDSSFLQVEQNKYLLAGQFHRADTNYLQLQISSEGVTLPEVLPLLSGRVNRTLQDIQIDQPIRAQFSLDELLVPGRRGAIQVDFAADSACVQYKDVNMTSVTLLGSFSNDCDRNGIGDSVSDCIIFEQLDGDIYGLLPAELKGRIDSLKNPQVHAAGKVAIELPRLNHILASNEKITFRGGYALVNFNYAGQLMDVLSSPFDEQNISMNGDIAFQDIAVDLKNRTEPLPLLSGQMFFDDQQTLLQELSLEWMGANIQLSGTLNNLPEYIFFNDYALNGDLLLHFDQLNLNNFSTDIPNKTKVKSSTPFDYKQVGKIARKIAANINGKIQLEIDDLRYDTLFFTDLKTQFNLLSPLLKEYSDSAMIRMDQLTANFMGDIPILVDLGFSQNSDTELLFDVDFPSAAILANMFLPKGTRITKGIASLQLSGQVPLRSLSHPDHLLSEFQYMGQISFTEVETTVNSFSWPIKKMSGDIIFNSDALIFDHFRFYYEGSPFIVNGLVKDYTFLDGTGDKKTFVDLKMSGSHLDWRNIQNSSLKTTIKSTSFSPPQLFRDLDTVFHHLAGKLDIRLDSILTKDQVIQPFVLQARLLPDEYNPKEHQVMVDSFNFGFGEKNNIHGNAKFTNPGSPQVDAWFQARMKLEKLGDFLPSAYLEMQTGYFKMDLHYRSPLYENLNAKNYLLNAAIDGEAKLINGKLFYNYRDFTFDDIYGHFHFDNRALYIEDLNLKINGNHLSAYGKSSDFFPFFILPDRRAHIALNVSSPMFDFGAFTAPHGLGKDTLLANTAASVQADSSLTILSKTGSFIDQLLNKGSLDMSTDIKALVYKEFTAYDIKGNISLEPDTVQLNDLRMNLAKGAFIINGSISDIIFHRPKLEIAAQFDRNNVREIFRQFEDFGQTHLLYKNIEGSASANITFKASINSNYAILPETMHGDMRVNLIGAQLIDVEALKKVSGFLFRKRRLDHIHIDTLNTFTHIRGSDLYIDKFYLHSSSFDFGVEGIYSLGKNNKTRILFAVPISNLFRRHLTSRELEGGNSRRKGMRVFIEAREKKNRMRFFLKIPIFGKKKYRLIEEEEGGIRKKGEF